MRISLLPTRRVHADVAFSTDRAATTCRNVLVRRVCKMCSDGELERTRDQNFDSSRNDNRQHAWRKCVASLRRNEQPVALICKRGCSNHSAKTTQAERSGGGSELTARHPPVP